MVQAGKARKFGDSGSSRVDEKRTALLRAGEARGNPNQTGMQPFGYNDGNVPNEPFLEDVERVSVHGFQIQGAIGHKRLECQLNATTKILDITKNAGTGALFREPAGHCEAIIDVGFVADLEVINLPKYEGQRLLIFGISTQTITVKNESPPATSKTIITQTGADVTFSGLGALEFIYEEAIDRWILVSGGGGGGAQCPVICTENDLGTVSGTVDVDWSLANFHRAVITGDTVFNFINTPADTLWQDICLEVQQDAIGDHAVSFQQVMDNGFVPVAITGAFRYTSWQIYTYEEPGGTNVFQAFSKAPGNTGPSVPGEGGVFQGFSGWIHAGLSGDQTANLVAGNHIEFDTILSNDSLIVSGGVGQSKGIFSGFRIGHVYECTAYLAGEGSASTLNFAAKWFDVIGGFGFGSQGHAIAVSGGQDENPQHVAKAFFEPTQLGESLRVDITDSFLLTSINNGGVLTEGACVVVIKDCGVTESTINQPEPAPEDISLDIREMTYLHVATNSPALRFSNFQGNLNNNTVASDQTAVQAGIIRELSIQVGQKGAGIISFQFRKNGGVFGPVFQLPANTTGFFEFLDLNLFWDRGDTIGWQTIGGVGGQPTGDEWFMTMVLWWI